MVDFEESLRIRKDYEAYSLRMMEPAIVSWFIDSYLTETFVSTPL